MSNTAVMEVLAPGLQTTVQDPGRFGFGQYGVAASGALDAFALRTANLLVGNPENAACLETMLLGLRVRALRDIAVAVTGADLQPQCDQKPFVMWRSQILTKGRELSFKGPRSGFRAYLAVGGGYCVPEIMGSRSTNLPAGFGGFAGRTLQGGDILRGRPAEAHLATADRSMAAADIPAHTDKWQLRVVPGPQEDHFTDTGLEVLLGTPYRVSPQSDRTGIRLGGEPIERRADVAESIISEGVVGGAIQIPGDGQPIIILNETVTGGYRKIATVISADLPMLGQIKPGDSVRFKAVSLADAEAALREAEAKIVRLRQSLTT